MTDYRLTLSEQRIGSSFHAFYDRYSRYVYKLAWQHCGCGIEVDDLVQEVWLRLCAKADELITFPPERQLCYISVTLRNTAISLARKEVDTLPLDVACGLAYQEVDSVNNALDRQLSKQHFQQLWPLIPQSVRELLERKYLLEESDAEIAHAMGIGVNSVRMYLSRARKIALSILSEHREQLI